MNLPADRMMLVESMNSEDNILINADEISAVRRYDERPMCYIGPDPQPYGRGLKITLNSGAVYRVETKMTLLEFNIERAKKFTPVVPEKTEDQRLADADWGESDWEVEEVTTHWSYYHKDGGQWIGVDNMGEAMVKARRHDSSYRAEMYRRVSKEWDAQDD